MKGTGQLGLNKSEAAILGAALDAADDDRSIAAVFLTAADSSTLKGTLQQMLPDHAGGAFEAATKGSRLTADLLADPMPLNGLWLNQVAWGSSKAIGDTSSYDVNGWGVTGGYDQPLGKIASVGVTATYLYGRDGNGSSELISNHYEGGVYCRAAATVRSRLGAGDGGDHRLRQHAQLRPFGGGRVTRTADGKWSGRLVFRRGGLVLRARMGRLTGPNALVEYYKLHEKGYQETGGGDGFDLTVLGRNSEESAATASSTFGYDLMGLEPDATWMRLRSKSVGARSSAPRSGIRALVQGRRSVHALPEKRTSGWRGAARAPRRRFAVRSPARSNAEEQQDKASLGGRLVGQLRASRFARGRLPAVPFILPGAVARIDRAWTRSRMKSPSAA